MSIDTQLLALKAQPDWPCTDCAKPVSYSKERCRSCAASRRTDWFGAIIAIGLILVTLWMFR